MATLSEMGPIDRETSWRDRLREMMLLKYGRKGKNIAEGLVGESEENKYLNYLAKEYGTYDLSSLPPEVYQDIPETRPLSEMKNIGSGGGISDIGAADALLMGMAPYSWPAALTESGVLGADAVGEYQKGNTLGAAIMGSLAGVPPLLRYGFGSKTPPVGTSKVVDEVDEFKNIPYPEGFKDGRKSNWYMDSNTGKVYKKTPEGTFKQQFHTVPNFVRKVQSERGFPPTIHKSEAEWMGSSVEPKVTGPGGYLFGETVGKTTRPNPFESAPTDDVPSMEYEQDMIEFGKSFRKLLEDTDAPDPKWAREEELDIGRRRVLQGIGALGATAAVPVGKIFDAPVAKGVAAVVPGVAKLTPPAAGALIGNAENPIFNMLSPATTKVGALLENSPVLKNLKHWDLIDPIEKATFDYPLNDLFHKLNKIPDLNKLSKAELKEIFEESAKFHSSGPGGFADIPNGKEIADEFYKIMTSDDFMKHTLNTLEEGKQIIRSNPKLAKAMQKHYDIMKKIEEAKPEHWDTMDVTHPGLYEEYLKSNDQLDEIVKELDLEKLFSQAGTAQRRPGLYTRAGGKLNVLYEEGGGAINRQLIPTEVPRD